ncbi:MAG: signal recognition particle-docking protein FtsY, partial [Nitrososphaerota archaeon]
DARGGSAISISYVTGKPIIFVGTGQGLDDLEPFTRELVKSLILGRR